MDAHRLLLLNISDRLGSEDVERLLFICPSVPYSESLKKGYLLFLQLEHQKKLGPGNYQFLSERLRQIGRVDLANMVAAHMGTVLPYNSAKFNSMQQTLDLLFASKRSYYQSEAVRLTNNHRNWEAIVTMGFSAISNACKIDKSVTFPELNFGNVGALLQDTLQVLHTLPDAFFRHLSIMNSSEYVDPRVFGPLVQECHESFDEFCTHMGAVQWSGEVRGKLLKMRNSRQDPVGVPAHNACKSIIDICNVILSEVDMERETSRTDQKLFFIESLDYGFLYYGHLLGWLATCIRLADSMQLDLSKLQYDIMKTVAKYREYMIGNYKILSRILGDQIMKKVLPRRQRSLQCLYQEHTQGQGAYDHARAVQMPFCALLLLLAASASDCTFNLHEVSERLEGIIRHMKSPAVETCINLKLKMARAMKVEVDNLRKRAIELCPDSSLQRTVVENLFADIHDTQDLS